MTHADASAIVVNPPLRLADFLLQGLREHPAFLASKSAVYLLAAWLGFSHEWIVVLVVLEVTCLLYVFRLALLHEQSQRYRAFALLTQEIMAAKRERLHFRPPFHRVGHEQSIQTTG